ncbi:type I-E CRISPR-associated protein Cas7/Cse4/CasC [Geodermatophilus sp. DF01-2]|uniref:type I-E CRISPR-associated protein Cas7/Cse4/CasC n=1 Tax=Geodermatophilus sp. DF01-2 TaxID=2559610 RepID=UPI00107484B1|nr:type I-E CRISPR-associated protein Cas7/Cse4/CasC [Geodermatophilus sp. DF01_2]TFV58352.1 type I-E CRISPR-associated protein Cas7/Cse4/CasC [Geodermatophilus sp. DF01_2]
MTRTYIDVHVLQTVPPSNLNRDDTGSPKTAFFGGVRRARVSSQAWKRAARKAFADQLDPSSLGVRSRRVVEVIADEIRRIDPSVDEAAALTMAEGVLKQVGVKLKPARKKEAPQESGFLLFLSRRQIENLAAAAVSERDGGSYPDDVKKLADREHSVDIALFGRMVADQTDLNVDAACQVAHALSVHAVEDESDYFTAVDDHKADDDEEDAGAGMIGTVEFNSSTLYRYATVDLAALSKNLGDPAAVQRAVEVFLDCFVTSMPTGKQNTFANRTLPDAILVQVRDDQPVSYAGAFEEAIKDPDGRVKQAVSRLASHAGELATAYGLQPVATFVAGPAAAGLEELGERRPWPEIIPAVGELVVARLGAAVDDPAVA